MSRLRLRGRLRGGGGASSFIPVTLPVAPQAFYSTSRLSTWAGSCCRVVRASDSAELDIGFVNNRIDMASAIAFRGASELTVKTWYDQSGNGFDATQATIANQPRLRTQNAWRGLQGLTIDSFIAASGGTQISKFLTIPAGVTLDRSATSGFTVFAPKSSYNSSAVQEIGVAPNRIIQWANSGSAGASIINSVDGVATRFWRGNPSVNSWRSNATNLFIGTDTTIDTKPPLVGGTSSGGIIGGSIAGVQFSYRGEFFTQVLYSSDVGSTNSTAIKTALDQSHSLNYSQENLIMVEGDSGAEGTGDQYTMNVIRQALPYLNKDVHVTNMAVHGSTAQIEYGRRVAKMAGVNRTVTGNKIITFTMGSNDISNGTSAATLWSSYYLPYIQYAQGLGYSVICTTILPRNDWAAAPAKETERLAFNTLLRDNAATYNYKIVDSVALPELADMAATADTTYWYTDRIHLNSTGMGLVAGLLYPKINEYLV